MYRPLAPYMPFAQGIIARCQKIPPVRQYACSQLLALSDHALCPGARSVAGAPLDSLGATPGSTPGGFRVPPTASRP